MHAGELIGISSHLPYGNLTHNALAVNETKQEHEDTSKKISGQNPRFHSFPGPHKSCYPTSNSPAMFPRNFPRLILYIQLCFYRSQSISFCTYSSSVHDAVSIQMLASGVEFLGSAVSVLYGGHTEHCLILQVVKW